MNQSNGRKREVTTYVHGKVIFLRVEQSKKFQKADDIQQMTSCPKSHLMRISQFASV